MEIQLRDTETGEVRTVKSSEDGELVIPEGRWNAYPSAGGYINVRAFGADGQTDDAAAVQAALNHLDGQTHQGSRELATPSRPSRR